MCGCLHISSQFDTLSLLRNMFRLFKYAFLETIRPIFKINILKHIKKLHKDQNKLRKDKELIKMINSKIIQSDTPLKENNNQTD